MQFFVFDINGKFFQYLAEMKKSLQNLKKIFWTAHCLMRRLAFRKLAKKRKQTFFRKYRYNV